MTKTYNNNYLIMIILKVLKNTPSQYLIQNLYTNNIFNLKNVKALKTLRPDYFAKKSMTSS